MYTYGLIDYPEQILKRRRRSGEFNSLNGFFLLNRKTRKRKCNDCDLELFSADMKNYSFKSKFLTFLLLLNFTNDFLYYYWNHLRFRPHSRAVWNRPLAQSITAFQRTKTRTLGQCELRNLKLSVFLQFRGRSHLQVF